MGGGARGHFVRLHHLSQVKLNSMIKLGARGE